MLGLQTTFKGFPDTCDSQNLDDTNIYLTKLLEIHPLENQAKFVGGHR
jgi:hypothetical protein